MKRPEPLIYFRTPEEIKAYRAMPAKEKLKWLEVQMEFFHKAMPEKAKKIRERFREGDIKPC